jgi:hypothetical protein
LGAFVHRHGAFSGHALGCFGAAELIGQGVEFEAKLVELLQLFRTQRTAFGFDAGQRLNLFVKFRAFAA